LKNTRAVIVVSAGFEGSQFAKATCRSQLAKGLCIFSASLLPRKELRPVLYTLSRSGVCKVALLVLKAIGFISTKFSAIYKIHLTLLDAVNRVR
jgi:hypothetical protein